VINSDPVVVQQRWLHYVLNPGALALKALLIMPFLEELFYRGMVLQLLRRFVPTWTAVFVSSAFFGITHVGNGWENAITAFLLGCIFASLVVRTGSLLASMLCHSLVNFTWLFLLTPAFGLLEKLIAWDVSLPLSQVDPLTLFPAWWVAASIVLAGVATWMLRKNNPRTASI